MASIINQATSISGYHSRLFPPASRRALRLAQPGTLALEELVGVRGLCIRPGHNGILAQAVGVRSNKLKTGQKIEGADIATHRTDGAVAIKVQPTDAHSRPLVSED